MVFWRGRTREARVRCWDRLFLFVLSHRLLGHFVFNFSLSQIARQTHCRVISIFRWTYFSEVSFNPGPLQDFWGGRILPSLQKTRQIWLTLILENTSGPGTLLRCISRSSSRQIRLNHFLVAASWIIIAPCQRSSFTNLKYFRARYAYGILE